jgi:hypothetical protein
MSIPSATSDLISRPRPCRSEGTLQIACRWENSGRARTHPARYRAQPTTLLTRLAQILSISRGSPRTSPASPSAARGFWLPWFLKFYGCLSLRFRSELS